MNEEKLIEESTRTVFGMYKYIDDVRGTKYMELLSEKTQEVIDGIQSRQFDTLKDLVDVVWEEMGKVFSDMKQRKVNFLAVIIPYMDVLMGLMSETERIVMIGFGIGGIDSIVTFLESNEEFDTGREEDLLFLMGVKALIDENIVKNVGGEMND